MCISIELGKKIKLEVDAAPAGMPLFVSITDQHGQSDYWMERIPADFGIGVSVRKIWDGKSRDFAHESYDVNLDTVSWCHSCECWAHLRYGKCRHVDCAVALMDQGLLSLPQVPVRAAV